MPWKDIYKKKVGTFSDILSYWKSYGLCLSSIACKRLFKKTKKNLIHFLKKSLLVRRKDVYNKNTWKLFQSYDESVLKMLKKKCKNLVYL